MYAATNGDASTATRILSAALDTVHTKDKYGKSAYAYAVENERPGVQMVLKQVSPRSPPVITIYGHMTLDSTP